MNKLRPRVAIIGAGAAGLSLARELLANGHPITIYEATSDIGGTWAYSPVPSPSSSLYESLRCNIPKQVMCFANRPFPDSTPSFAHHTEVLAYLRNYAEEHDLRPHIIFNARVSAVRKVSGVWLVRASGEEQAYGAVGVAVGHYTTSNPWRPPGAKEFSREGRTIIHSHAYKTPHRYKGRRVLVVGAGPSGTDVAVELSSSAAEVTLAHSGWRNRLLESTAGEIGEIGSLARLTGQGEVFSVDGDRVVVDDIVMCTGFQYGYPFLEEGEVGVRVADDGRSVRGLVGHLYAKKDPTLAFMGLLWKIIPFPLFEDQAGFLAALWGGRISSRRLAEYERIERKDWEIAMAGEERFLHRLADHQWEYRRRLADVAGRPLPSTSTMEIAQDASAARHRDLCAYREREYVVLGPGAGEWRAIVDGVDVTGKDDPAPPRSVPNCGAQVTVAKVCDISS